MYCHTYVLRFIGHSMGAVVVRAVVANERLSHLRANLCTFLSLNAPHCGVHNNRSVVSSIGLNVRVHRRHLCT
jgi:surfactin synthase thioesterase subunit